MNHSFRGMLCAVALACMAGCGGSGDAPPATSAPPDAPVPVVTYGPAMPSDWPYVTTVASMYALDASGTCDPLDPYCRVVADKDAFVQWTVHSAMQSGHLLVATISGDAQSLPIEKSPLGTWSIRVPAKYNTSTTRWSVQWTTLTGSSQHAFDPLPIVRDYFEAEPFNVVIVPIRINGVSPVLPNIFNIANAATQYIPLPLGSLRIADPVDSTAALALVTTDDFANVLRDMAQQMSTTATGRTLVYGVYSSTVRSGAYVGMAFQPGNVALGSDEPATFGYVMTHELGHSLSLSHTACGNPNGKDKKYPYPEGDISFKTNGVYRVPFDLHMGIPRWGETKDVMGYCSGQFFSDYSTRKIWNFWKTGETDISVDGSNVKRTQQETGTSEQTKEEFLTQWENQRPSSPVNRETRGDVYEWMSGSSIAPLLRRVSSQMEFAIAGYPIQVLHDDLQWHNGMAYRTGENRVDIWTPGLGSPTAIR